MISNICGRRFAHVIQSYTIGANYYPKQVELENGLRLLLKLKTSSDGNKQPK